MPVASTVARGRAAADRLMTDTCLVKRLDNTTTTTDPETGIVTKAYDTVYSGPGKVQRTPSTSRVTPSVVGEAERFQSRLELHIPTTVTGILADDIVTVTASTSDPDLVGKTFHVREIAVKTWQTARRYGIEYAGS